MFVPDNYSQWEEHERQAEARLARRPVCYECGEHIQDDFCYEINGDYYCEDCLDMHFRKAVEDLVE